MTPRLRNVPGQIAAAIFDFDETMIDLERQHNAACVRLCEAMGVRYEDMPEEFRVASGKRVVDDIADMKRFFEWTLGDDQLLAQRQLYFDEEIASADLTLMPGVERFVRDIAAGGLRLAIASSSVRKSIETILERFDLRHLFEVIVDGSEVSRGKPDPEAYVVTAKRLALDPERCVVFEDSSVGVRAAKAAGMFCVAVRNPHAHVHQDLAPADWIASSFEEIDAQPFIFSSASNER